MKKFEIVLMVFALALVGLIEQAYSQEKTTVYFKNKTDGELTIRCFAKHKDLPGFWTEIPKDQSKGTTELVPGKRVFGAWASGEVASQAYDFIPNVSYQFTVTKRKGKLVIEPPEVLSAPAVNPFTKKIWQTVYRGPDLDGNALSAVVDFRNGTFSSSSVPNGKLTGVKVTRTTSGWKLTGQWSGAQQSGRVSFSISQSNQNSLSGWYTFNGSPTHYSWTSK